MIEQISVVYLSLWYELILYDICMFSFSITMGQLYEKEKDEDGFLYVAYSGENTFGF